ncbi:MAG: hypothetical protein IJD25_03385 [Alphaproteobacteria bacterium]|nr:hypothetical protein [Alphaproteobacteria bacterium]
MKKALMYLSFALLVGGIFSSSTGQAQHISNQTLSTCMLHLPQVVLISQDMCDLNFSKSQYVDAFWDYESAQKGMGYSYSYQNSFCQAKVHLYKDNQVHLTNTKVQRLLKDKTSFFVQKQKNLKIGKTKFYGAYGEDEDISNMLLYGDYKDHVLKIRMTCAILPRFLQSKYQQTVDEMTTIFAESIVDSLNACVK